MSDDPIVFFAPGATVMLWEQDEDGIPVAPPIMATLESVEFTLEPPRD